MLRISSWQKLHFETLVDLLSLVKRIQLLATGCKLNVQKKHIHMSSSQVSGKKQTK